MKIPEYVVERIRQTAPLNCGVIVGSTPVISFGDPNSARVATIGSNPAKSAFLDGGSVVATFFETMQSLY